MMAKKSKLEITFGDLIVALTEAAQQHIHDERAAYEVVAQILAGLLNSKDPSRRGAPTLTVATVMPGVRPANYGKTPVINH
jgi:hypothetical protein